MEETRSRATGEAAEEGPAIGIDLGTTYSCVGVWKPHQDRVEIISNDLGNRTTPSMVAFNDVQRLIGEAAQNQAAKNPSNTIFEVKRLIGRSFVDATVQNDVKNWPFKVIAGPDGKKPMIAVTFKGEEKQFGAEEISSMILHKMKSIAEAYLGKQVKKSVITVPAYFNDFQRQSTKDAGLIAGLNVLRIINEPTASAFAYGIDKKEIGSADSAINNILVFDLGGGTFDVSIVIIEKNACEVKAVNGDTHLGGVDFSNRMVSHFVAEFERKHHKDISKNLKALARLRAACERAKRILSLASETLINIECLFEGIDFSSTITRARFENMNVDLFENCIETVEKCLKDAKMKKLDIHDVVLVGGSTRIPMVQELLQDFFHGKQLCKNVNPDEVVAFGAAFHAATLTNACLGKNKDAVLKDVCPLSLGIEEDNGEVFVVIPRNTPIPTKMTMRTGTAIDYQNAVCFPVYEGEMSIAKENNFLGEFFIYGIPPASKGKALFKVDFEIDADGILTVSAKLEGSKKRNQITITNHSGRLSKEDIDRMVKEAEDYKAQEEEHKKAMDAKNALENLIHHTRGCLMGFRTKASRLSLKSAIDNTARWLEWNNLLGDAHKFEEKIKELKSIYESAISQMQHQQGSDTIVQPEIIDLSD